MAKVYLDSGDTFALSGAATVTGSTGTEKVIVNTGVTGVVVDANVERVDLPGASSAYTFQQAGNQLKVFSGTTLVATITPQEDTDGTQVVFSNGSVSAKVGATGMTLGGATVSSTTAGAVTPTTIDATVTSGSGSSTGGSNGTYTLASDMDTVVEGKTATFTVTRSGDVTAAKTLTFNASGDTNNTTVAAAAAGVDASPASGTVTFAAGAKTATFTVSANADTAVEGLEGLRVRLFDGTTAVADKVVLINDDTTGTSVPGNTYTLTTLTDNITGTSGNDTIIGDVGTTVTVQGSDQIAGGAGTDTFKIYGSFTAGTSATGVVTGVENLYIATVAGADQNFSSLAKSATGIEKIEIADASSLNSHIITTTAGQSLSLATGASNTHTAGTVTWAGSATDTSLNLTLNGYQGGASATPVALTVTGAAATTLNVASTGAANKVGTTATTYFTGPTTVTKHVVTGDKALTMVLAAADVAKVATVDASASTGGVTYINQAGLTAATYAFTGGSGDDTVSFVNDEFGTLNAGTQLNGGAGTDKIGLYDTAVSATEAAKINAAISFEKIGINGAGLTLDASTVSIKAFDIDTTGLTTTITNLATGSTVTVGAGTGAAFTQTSLTLGGQVGVTDVAIVLGATTDTNAHAVTDAVLTGLTNVKITSNGTAANTLDTGVMVNSDNTTFTINGSAGLTLGRIAATTTGSKVDGSAATGALTMVGNNTAFASGSALGDILIGGSKADNIKAAVNGGTLTGNAGNDTFDVSVALGGTTATFNTTTITDFTKGDKLKVIGTAFTAAKVDLSGAASVGAALDLLAAGNASGVKWGVYNGNTYVVDDVGAGATFAATDIMVKLTGTLDLSTSTFASNTLTFA